MERTCTIGGISSCGAPEKMGLIVLLRSSGALKGNHVKNKYLRFLVGIGIGCLLIGAGPSNISAQKSVPKGKSGKQEVTWEVLGDCVDEFDDYQSEFVVYEGEQCFFAVTVVPAKPIRTVAIQWKDPNGRWVSESVARTNKNGTGFLYPDTLDVDSDFLCDSFDYRIGLARLGNAKSLVSEVFNITYVAESYWC